MCIYASRRNNAGDDLSAESLFKNTFSRLISFIANALTTLKIFHSRKTSKICLLIFRKFTFCFQLMTLLWHVNGIELQFQKLAEDFGSRDTSLVKGLWRGKQVSQRFYKSPKRFPTDICYNFWWSDRRQAKASEVINKWMQAVCRQDAIAFLFAIWTNWLRR